MRLEGLMALFRREGDLIHVSAWKFYLLTAAVAVAGFGGGAAFASAYLAAQGGSAARAGGSALEAARVPSGANALSVQERLVGDARHAIGPANAPVTIVEFTDYDCPFCRRHYQLTFPQIMEKYGSQVRYVLRHFPLVSMHPDAAKAAEAAECAGQEGRFWEFHDLVMRGVPSLDAGSLKQYAAEIGVNTEAFNRCLDDGAMAATVQRDLRDGYMHGVRGTPNFFVNGYSLSGAQPLEVFTAYIEAALSGDG
jgi:protein-disulfide isomerase